MWVRGNRQTDHWIDVSEQGDTALKAIMQHPCQVDGRAGDEVREHWQRWRRERAIGKGMQYAEAFKKIYFRR